MPKEYIWEVKAKNTPLLNKKCNRCDSDRFYCSEKFRMNAQKKNIDIWLIYRCIKCDSTYNMTIFSRTKPESVNKALFNSFSRNDTAIAWEYAFSPEAKQKNNLEFDYGSVEYEIQHDGITAEDLINIDSEAVTFKIRCPFDFNLKLSSVIRVCLKLSAGRLNQLIEMKVISVQEKHLQKKHKVKNGDVIRVNMEKLKSVYRSIFACTMEKDLEI